ncbi:MAG: FGGY-family carbohydrate kinase [Candidatus Buchananbacteria bacterium]
MSKDKVGSNQPPLFFAYDLGTDGLTGQVRGLDGALLAEASADYGYGSELVAPNMPEGVMVQNPCRWENAMREVNKILNQKLSDLGLSRENAYVGLVGQMHGLVWSNCEAAPLWCDDRNADVAQRLTQAFGVKMAQRFTVSRLPEAWEHGGFSDYIRNGIFTPGGYIFNKACLKNAIGVGEASGMFPIEDDGAGFCSWMMQKFDRMYREMPNDMPSLSSILPSVHQAGEFIGQISFLGTETFGLPFGAKVIPFEGDQQGALAGSLIGRPGEGALSLGTSFVLNVLSDRPFSGISPAIDPFKTADGKNFLMIWIKNGGRYLKMMIAHYCDARGDANTDVTFAALMSRVEAMAKEYPDCRGLLGLPFLINEPGAGFDEKGISLLFGLNPQNDKAAHLLHLALLLPLFGIRNGMDELEAKDIVPKRLVLTGGIMHSKSYAGPTIANVCNREVFIPDVATEGTCYGAYVLTLFAYRKQTEPDLTLPDLLDELAVGRQGQTYCPDPKLVEVYNAMCQKFNALKDVGRQILADPRLK